MRCVFEVVSRVETVEPPRASACLLTRHQVHLGTEPKYLNTVAFFDHCTEEWLKAKAKDEGDGETRAGHLIPRDGGVEAGLIGSRYSDSGSRSGVDQR